MPQWGMGVLRFIRAVLGALVLVGCIGAAGLVLLFLLPGGGKPPSGGGAVADRPSAAAAQSPPQRLLERLPLAGRFFAFRPAAMPVACLPDGSRAAAAADNAASVNTAVVSPFSAPETGWAVYAPLIAHEIGTGCAPQDAGFAAAFARWQTAHGLAATGRVDQPALSAMGNAWLLQRPFVRAMKTGCPASPDEHTLARADPQEAFGGKAVLARPGALDAYRRMVAAARAETGARPPLLTLASGYRGPDEEAARCADGSCGNPRKAHCSAHRTGLAFDLYLGAAPGFDPFSTTDANRTFQAASPAYRWLVANAGRFGFVPYPFEPWHWEWTGEPV